MTFHAVLLCEGKKSEQAFTIAFDDNGNLDREESKLGKLG